MSFITFRKPTLRITRTGVHLSPGSVRVGSREFGINIGRSGVSASARTPLGTINTKRGLTVRLWPWK